MTLYAYDLTGLTGRKKNVDRTMVVATVEVNRFSLLVTVASAVASLPVAVLTGYVIGAFAPTYWWLALGVPVLAAIAGVVLVDQRARGGLRLRRYQTFLETRRGRKQAQQVLVCGQPLTKPSLRILIPQFIDAPAAQAGDIARGERVRTRTGKANLLDA